MFAYYRDETRKNSQMTAAVAVTSAADPSVLLR